MPRGLYVHIPFCHKKCHYCDFVITTDRSVPARERFLSAIEREIRFAREKYGRLNFDTLYFGGGTPSTLSIEEMARLIRMLRQAFNFRPSAEITCEMNPEDADEKKLRAWRDFGINRASLGAQSFDNTLLTVMGRSHDSEAITRAVIRLRDSGFQNINLDLIIKLPGQTIGILSETLDRLTALKPSHVSVYDLDVHEKTVFGHDRKKGRLKLPDEEIHFEMSRLVESKLAGAKLHRYELLNYARPGAESNHNLIYWHNQEYLGLGPGAFSYLEGVRFQFAENVLRYFRKIESHDWSPDVRDEISGEKKEIETLLTGLRLAEGIDLSRLTIIRERIEQKAAESGLFERENGTLRLSRRGRGLAETAFSILIGG